MQHKMLNPSSGRQKVKSQLTMTTTTSSISSIDEEDFSPPPNNHLSTLESNINLLTQKLSHKVLLINNHWKKRFNSEIHSHREQLDFINRKAHANYKQIRQERKKREKEYKVLQQQRLKQRKMKNQIVNAESHINISLDKLAEIKNKCEDLSSSFAENAQKYEDQIVQIDEYELAKSQLTQRLNYLNSSTREKLKVKEGLRQKIKKCTIKNHILKVQLEQKSNNLSIRASELHSVMKTLSEKSKIIEEQLTSTDQRITEIQSRIFTNKFFPS